MNREDVKLCIKCGEEFNETYDSYALDCQRCMNKDENE